MNSTVQFCVLPLSETDPEIIRLLEKSSGGFAGKDGRLYILADDRIFMCEDTPDGKKLLGKLTAETSEGPEPEAETLVWKDLLNGYADESAMRNPFPPDAGPGEQSSSGYDSCGKPGPHRRTRAQ